MNPIALAVLAHPDDAEFLCAGTLTRLRKEHGWEVHIASMTPGDCGSAEHGPDEISRIRRGEVAAEAPRGGQPARRDEGVGGGPGAGGRGEVRRGLPPAPRPQLPAEQRARRAAREGVRRSFTAEGAEGAEKRRNSDFLNSYSVS